MVNVLLVLGFFVLQIILLAQMNKRNLSFNVRVLSGLVLGLVYGAVLQLIFGLGHSTIKTSLDWISLVGTGYVRLLRMIIIPLIFISIVGAFISQKKGLGKVAARVMAVLMITVAISALVGALTTAAFHLSAADIQAGDAEKNRGQSLESTLKNFSAKPVQQQILEIIPTNPFYAMTGQESNSTLATVFFATMIALAALELLRFKPKSAEKFIDAVQVLHDIVMRMVSMIMRLTPYGVLALMTRVAATSNTADFGRLLKFIVANYVALIIMFIIHLVILFVFKLNPFTFVKKASSALLFAFTSRTSAGTLPLTVDCLVNKMGVPESNANLAASLGVSIGQNGCAGIYPAMLAVMIAPTLGINPLDPVFLTKLIAITTLTSFGIAGVGGGATFAALAVLSSLGFPVALAGLLIAIEPLIDMGRTLLNVSDAMISALVSSKSLKTLDESVYNGDNSIAEV